jgi:hypothetical protein
MENEKDICIRDIFIRVRNSETKQEEWMNLEYMLNEICGILLGHRDI